MATTINIWQGVRSFTGYSDYESISFCGEELGAVRFTNELDIQYRIFRTESGNILIQYIERDGYDCTAEVFEYPNLEEATAVHRFVLKKAGVI